MGLFMISLEHVTRKFGPITAVDDLSIAVKKGEVLGFLGPNGAGKTTTMRMISGFLMPTAGTVTVCGTNVVEDPVAVKSAIGYMPEHASSYPEMTVLSFLNFIAEARGLFDSEKEKAVERIIDQISLTGVVYQTIETLSKGYKRRVGLAQALIHDPKVLILDEPTEGLDPNQKKEIRSLIRRIRENKAIIISTHVLEEVEAVCTRAVIIDKGRIVLDGTPKSLLTKGQNKKALYFRLPEFQAPRGKTIFDEFPGLEKIETVETAEKTVLFRLTPTQQSNPVGDLVEILHRQNIEITDMYVEKGRLEDVFYAYTSSEHETKVEQA